MTATIWLAIFFVFLVWETIKTTVTPVWFSLGALGAFAVSLMDLPLWLQLVCFAAISVPALIFLRPVVKKHFRPDPEADGK